MTPHAHTLCILLYLIVVVGANTHAAMAQAQTTAGPQLLTAEPNDHRQSAGRMIDGVLYIELEAVLAEWRPRGLRGPSIVTPVFAEAGAAPSVPGPLIRAPAGTPIHVSIRNRLDRPIAVRGLFDRATADISRPANAYEADPDFFFSKPLAIAPGETRVRRFTPTAPVTSFYYARIVYPEFAGDPVVPGASGNEGAFIGALVIDQEGSPPENERLFVITRWGDRSEPITLSVTFKMMINGRSWPYTERLSYAVGDTVRWRILNASAIAHPMHLHGFYFSIDGRGNTDADTVYSAANRPQVVTDVMPDFSSLRLTWTPERPGNWLFHCHLIRHMGALQQFAAEAHPDHQSTKDGSDSMAMDGMAGLVLGIVVDGPEPDEQPPNRILHLWTSTAPRMHGDYPALSFVATDGYVPPIDTIVVPGTPLILERGEPTEINVHNRLDVPMSVHWHGLEVQSLYDGVGHWSGGPGMTRPPVEPGATARVLIEPPRAGTFIYHIHGEIGHELTQGLYGPLIVLPPGEQWDPAHDRVFVLSARGSERDVPPAVNGEERPAPQRFTAGEPVRLRFIHISPDAFKRVRLLRDGDPVTWLPLAKDGADLPHSHRHPTAADFSIGVGETYDFEWSPDRDGIYVLEVETEHYSASQLPPALQRIAFGVGEISEDALLEASYVETEEIKRDTTRGIFLSEEALRKFVGEYEGDGVPVTFTVEMDERGLLLTTTGGEPGRLVPIGETLFRWEDPVALRAQRPFGRVSFEIRNDSMVMRVFGARLTRIRE